MQLTGSSRAGKVVKKFFLSSVSLQCAVRYQAKSVPPGAVVAVPFSILFWSLETKGNHGRAALVHHLIWNEALEAVQISN